MWLQKTSWFPQYLPSPFSCRALLNVGGPQTGEEIVSVCPVSMKTGHCCLCPILNCMVQTNPTPMGLQRFHCQRGKRVECGCVLLQGEDTAVTYADAVSVVVYHHSKKMPWVSGDGSLARLGGCTAGCEYVMVAGIRLWLRALSWGRKAIAFHPSSAKEVSKLSAELVFFSYQLLDQEKLLYFYRYLLFYLFLTN